MKSKRIPRLVAITGIIAAGVATTTLTTAHESAADELTPPVATIPTGGSPSGAAVDTSTGMVYTANNYSGTVTVINGRGDITSGDPARLAVATVHVGSHPSAVAVDSRTDRVYVANAGSESVSVIDGHDNKVIATIHNIVAPAGVAVVEATDRVYVTSDYGPRSLGRVDVVDGRTNHVISQLPVGISPSGIAANQVTQRLYVSNSAGNAVSSSGYFVGSLTVIQGTSPIATVQVGLYNSPEWVAVDQANNRAYVSFYSEDTSGVVVVDTSTNRSIAEIDVDQPQGLAVDPNLNRVYVAEGYDNGQGGLIYVIDTKVNELSEEVNMSNQPNNPGVQEAGNPWAPAVDTTTGRLFVAYNQTPGVVRAVDLGHYYIPAPPAVPSTSVPLAPIVPPTTTTTLPKPTTTVASVGPAPVNTWCWLLRKAGGNAIFAGIDNGAASIESNGPISGTTACDYNNGGLEVYLGPSAQLIGGAPYEQLPALGKGAGLWLYRGAQVWWPYKNGWLYIWAFPLVGQTAAEMAKYVIPPEIAVAKKVETLLGS
jgi:YVTN family beta-propeller protein